MRSSRQPPITNTAPPAQNSAATAQSITRWVGRDAAEAGRPEVAIDPGQHRIVGAAAHTAVMTGPRGGGRVYLEVPYSEREQAKALGARWDPAARRWWAPPAATAARRRWPAPPEVPALLPGEDRTFGAGLFVDLVPTTSWFTHARSAPGREAALDATAGRAGQPCFREGTWWPFFRSTGCHHLLAITEKLLAERGCRLFGRTLDIDPVGWAGTPT